jgi:hypothetical protein
MLPIVATTTMAPVTMKLTTWIQPYGPAVSRLAACTVKSKPSQTSPYTM